MRRNVALTVFQRLEKTLVCTYDMERMLDGAPLENALPQTGFSPVTTIAPSKTDSETKK